MLTTCSRITGEVLPSAAATSIPLIPAGVPLLEDGHTLHPLGPRNPCTSRSVTFGFRLTRQATDHREIDQQKVTNHSP